MSLLAGVDQFIYKGCYKRIALQFPDNMLSDSINIVSQLKNEWKINHNTEDVPKFFILGDTSYGSCCVDYVAAAHVQADAIIHFGTACLNHLNGPNDPSVFFCFGCEELNIDIIRNSLKDEIINEYNNDNDTKSIILFYDLCYSHYINELKDIINEFNNNDNIIPNCILASLKPVSCSLYPHYNNNNNNNNHNHNNEIKNDENDTKKITSVGGFTFQSDEICNSRIIIIGQQGDYLLNLMLRCNQAKSIRVCTPEDGNIVEPNANSRKIMARRYFLIEKAKTCNIIGILMGSMGVSQYINGINHIKELIKESEKTSQLFIVGKINEPKISNFSEIEIFVLISCSFTSLIDTQHYYHDIITPYELEIALNPNRSWTGEYSLELCDILPNGSHYIESIQKQEDVTDEPEYSMFTRKFISKTTNNDDNDNEDYPHGSTALVSIGDGKMITKGEAKTVLEHFHQRTFKGLDMMREETNTKIEQGQSGIARIYEEEG